MSKAQLQAKIQTKGAIVTTSEKTAKTAKNMPEVQHVFSCEIEGKMTHRFIKKVTC